MESFQDINDVATLKALLASQQQQLQQLQQQGQQQASNKRKSTKTDYPAEEFSSDGEEEPALDKDDDIYDPANDSDYKDAPKKKKAGASSSKKQKGSGRKKARRESFEDDDDSCSDSDADVPTNSKQQQKTVKAAEVALRSVKSAINQQMVYRPSLKRGTSRVSLELPCLSEAVVQAVLGPQLLGKASNGKKQLQLKATNEDLGALYGGWSPFGKSLRYGAQLELINGLTFTFNKATSVLKVHGTYTMIK